MSLIQRAPPSSGRPRGPAIAIALLATFVFLSTLRFGLPTATSGLDPSWKEVLAWSYLHHAQWGRDLIFTYGPTGFLYPLATYLDGIFWPFILGQIVLTAAFSLIAAIAVYRSGLLAGLAFAAAFCAWNGWVPGEISWPLTLLFGTSLLVDTDKPRSDRQSLVLTAGLALVFGVIALSKFSLLPIWFLCVLSLSASVALGQSLRRGTGVLCLFVGALLVVWLASSQHLGNLFDFLANGSEIASGYGHAMGFAAPPSVEGAAFGCLAAFAFLSALVAWRVRREPACVLVPLLYIIAALWAWRAHFTRGDHAPYFFAFLALLPCGLLCSRSVACSQTVKLGLLLLSLACASASFFPSAYGSPATRVAQLVNVVRDNVRHLTHLRDLQAQRTAEWAQAQHQAALPEISRRVGSASVDMVGVEQTALLLNGLNYAPRPVFQSYSAYTPRLAKLNEAYFLGPQAPDFVILKPAPIDRRLPMQEDALALIALLRRYQTVALEKGYVLLQRSGSVTLLPFSPAQSLSTATLGQDIRVKNSATPSVAFVKIDLTWLGKLYSLLLREPPLKIIVQTDNGPIAYRIVRPTSASGFIISPLLQSTRDWAALQFGLQGMQVHGFRIETEIPWHGMLFDRAAQVTFQPLRDLQASAQASTLISSIFPGFSHVPTSLVGINGIIEEGGKEALFLHAPSAIEFRPAPGHYEISAQFGIQAAALSDSKCAAANADGVGISVTVRHTNSAETLLTHRDLDPFRVPADRGPQEVAVADIVITPGDRVGYRVDPGHAGTNTACDWSYVRDLKLTPAQMAPN